MTRDEFRKIMDLICPEDLAEEWDNSGFQIAFEGEEIGRRIFVALDIRSEVIEEAVSAGADTIVTHHPLFFDPLRTITFDEPAGRYAQALIRNGISVYSAHTNFDKMQGGINDEIGRLLGARNVVTAGPDGFARCGDLGAPMGFDAFCGYVAERLGIDKHTFRLAGKAPGNVRRVAWCGGAGADFASVMKETGADIFLTGDLKYHIAMDAAENGLVILDIGHFGSEKCFTERMAELIREKMPEGTVVIPAKCEKDCWTQL